MIALIGLGGQLSFHAELGYFDVKHQHMTPSENINVTSSFREYNHFIIYNMR